MKMRNPKSTTPKRRNFVALHSRNLKGGRHNDRRDRRPGNRGGLSEWIDEMDETPVLKDDESAVGGINEEGDRK